MSDDRHKKALEMCIRDRCNSVKERMRAQDYFAPQVSQTWGNVMNKTKTICFTNNKGGSGKSTTCSNIGAAMARAGKKVLMIDGDMQLNLSLAFLDVYKRQEPGGYCENRYGGKFLYASSVSGDSN